MIVTAALLAVAVAAPAAAPATGSNTTTTLVPARAAAPASGARAAPPAACTKYRVLAEKSELGTDQEIAAWATAALERASLHDKGSPCWIYVRITAAPIRTGGKQDGWHAHVAASTRRYLKDGKLVSNERGMLLVEAQREALAARARTFLEEYVARLGAAPGGAIPSDG
jgi:hypothetical protein